MSGIINVTGAKSGVVGTITKETTTRFPSKDAISTSNLIGWWKDAGISDTSGNGRNGTLSGSVTTVTNQFGPWQGAKTVTRYPDSGGYISIPNSCIIGGAGDRTVTFWYKPAGGLDSGNYFFGMGSCTTGGTFNGRGNENRMSFMGCGQDHDSYGETIFRTGVWGRYWYTYDQSGTNSIRTYYTFDGSIHLNWEWATNLNTNTGGNAAIGAHANSPSNNSAFGDMRDFRIYNRALQPDEMCRMWDD